MKKFVVRVAIFLILSGLIPPLETVSPVQAKLSFFTDNIEVGPVTTDTITIDWGSATDKYWDYFAAGALPCPTSTGSYTHTDLDSLNQTDTTHNDQYICVYVDGETETSAHPINIALCPDNVISGDEECDDGNTAPGDGCDATCAIEIGWSCNGEPSSCTADAVCGNTVIETGEECDDGNIVPGDGCDATCQIEDPWVCTGAPSVCNYCGNNSVEGNETCDDGNIAPNDGCSATCAIENGWSCSGSPSSCSVETPTFPYTYDIGVGSNADATVDGSGNVYAVYENGGSIYLAINRDTPEVVTTGSSPALWVATDGTPHILYLDGGVIKYTTKAGGSWSPASAVTGTVNPSSFDFDFDTSGYLHVVYSKGSSESYDDIIYTTNTSGSFVETNICHGYYWSGFGGSFCGHPVGIKVDASGYYHIAYISGWRDSTPSYSTKNMAYTTNAPGGGAGSEGFNWNSAPVGTWKNNIALDNTSHPNIIYSSGGNLYRGNIVGGTWSQFLHGSVTTYMSIHASGNLTGLAYYNSGVQYLEGIGSVFSSSATVDAAGVAPVAVVDGTNRYVYFEKDGHIYLATDKNIIVISHDATVSSATYTVSAGGTATETISGVLYGTSKADFLSALTKGDVNQTWNESGLADPVVTGNTLVVTAQDGTTTVTYTIVDHTDPTVGAITVTPSVVGDPLLIGKLSTIEAPVADTESGINPNSCRYNINNGASSFVTVPGAYSLLEGKCIFTNVDTSLASGAIAVSVDDNAGNWFNTTGSWVSITVDKTNPSLSEETPIPTLTNNNTPTVILSTNELANPTFTGPCQSAFGQFGAGNNSVVLDQLSDGTYDNCSLTLTDRVGNTSAPLTLSTFTIDTTKPLLSATSASALTPTTADLHFTTNEGGTYYYLVYLAPNGPILGGYPSAAKVKAQGAAVTKGTAAVGVEAKTVAVAGLTAATGYNAYFIVEDAAGNLSNVSKIPFTTPSSTDTDGDLIIDANDNCVSIANSDQADNDNDWLGNVCDNCVNIANSNQADDDSDGIGNACDPYNCVATGAEICDGLDNNCDTNIDEGGVCSPNPVVTEVTPVPVFTNDVSPTYTFNSDSVGTITYGGDCSSATTAATAGDNTVTFNTLSEGQHSNCTILVTDSFSHASNLLAVSSFTIDTTLPQGGIVSPNAGTDISGLQEIQTSVSDDSSGIQNVCVWFGDGAPASLAGCASTSPYSVFWNTQLSEDRTYSVYVKITDNANNEFTSTATLLTINNADLGTAGNPQLITTCQDLQNISQHLTRYYQLTNDIDCSVTTTWNGGHGFLPINNFSGTLDGQNHTVSNLFLNSSDHGGIFDTMSGTVKQVNFWQVNITGSGYTGGLVNDNTGTIEKVSLTGQVTCASQQCGGLAGKNSGLIKQSWTDIVLNGPNYVGSIVGHSMSSGRVENCYAKGSVTGNADSGGIVGLNQDSSVIYNSYSTAQTPGTNEIGGLAGWFYNGGSQSGSYWDVETSGKSNMCGTNQLGGGECDNTRGLTDSAMKQQSSFVGWDFAGIWAIDPAKNDGYPYLAWQTTWTVSDVTKPVITLSGTSPVTIYQGDAYSDAGATATDNVDGVITGQIVTVNPVNSAVIGSYTVTYDVTDAAGNAATQVTRTVNVVARPSGGGGGGGGATYSAPTLSLVTPADLTATYGLNQVIVCKGMDTNYYNAGFKTEEASIATLTVNEVAVTPTITFEPVASGTTSPTVAYLTYAPANLPEGAVKVVCTLRNINGLTGTVSQIIKIGAGATTVVPPTGSFGGGSGAVLSTEETLNTGSGATISFRDIAGHWAEDYILRSASGGYISGYADGTFRPDEFINRAEVSKIITKYLAPTVPLCLFRPYSDVFCSSWYAKYVNHLKVLGIVSGYADNTFRPTNFITRAEALKMLLKAAGLDKTDVRGMDNPYQDVATSMWYFKYIMIGHKLGLVNGYVDNTFHPDDYITRAEFIKMFVKILLNK